MTSKPIRAITFDLWDTVFVDDSDEPKRKAAGLPPKPIHRRNLLANAVNIHETTDRDAVNVAYDTADAAFNSMWHDYGITLTVAQRLQITLDGLHKDLASKDFEQLVLQHEQMELEVRPNLAVGVAEALAELHGKFALGVISDAVFSPGRSLKTLLEDFGIVHFFDSFIFSDEQGRSKPNPVLFQTAARQLEVNVDQIVHIGDREDKDIVGAQNLGAKALLCTVVKDRGSDRTSADAVLENYADLYQTVRDLNSR